MIRIDKHELLKSLTIDDIKNLLQELGATEVIDEVDSKNQLITNTICHNTHDGKMKLYYYPNEDGGQFHCYTDCGCSFNIYGLVERSLKLKGNELSFPQIIDYVATKTGKSNVFGGFGFQLEHIERENDEVLDWMDKVSKKKKVEPPEITVINESILRVFSKRYPSEFLNDHITTETMDKFMIGYYDKASRITIPHYNPQGELIGIRGRYTGIFTENTQKYMPVTVQGKTMAYPTMYNLYGLYQNIEAIKKHKKIIIFESEKSVMQCYSIWKDDCYAVALSGSSLSKWQIDLILSLDISKVIIATDKEFKEAGTELELRAMKKMLEMGRKFSPYVSTFCLWDTEGLLEYKDSPSDHGEKTLLRLMKDKQEILNISEEISYKSNVY